MVLLVKKVMGLLLMSALLSSIALAAPKARQVDAKPAKAVPVKIDPKGDPLVGKEKAESERCLECHGLTGQGAEHPTSAEAKFAKLAGQYPDYILKQIRDFRSGARKHDQMAIVARNVSDEDVLDIAAYFASQAVMNGKDGDLHEAGKALYQAGDATRGIVACVSCHGVKGKGLETNKLAPILGGQEWRYLDQQLRSWRSGERRNSPDGVMNKATSALTDKEIESLADYLSGL